MSIAEKAQQLVDMTASEQARAIAAGELSSAELVDAHIARIQQTAGEINAVTQPRFDQARAEATQADARRAAGDRLGLLGGVPITIKDCFAVRGLETTLGIPGYSNGPAEEDSPLVARLRGAGAIVLGKTNVSQAMLLHECDNPVFGRTSVPGFPDRSPGGSTGGEPAVIAAGGSPLGLGSDLGGSIRQPAAACGLFGLKPTTARLTIVGSERAISRGMQAIPIQPGPIARSVADLDLAMQVLCDNTSHPRQWDESETLWRDYRSVDVSQLRIAWWANDGVFVPAAGMARAVEEAANSLTAKVAEVVPTQAIDIAEMTRIYFGLVSADALGNVRRLTRGGKLDSQLARQIRLARLPRWLRRGLGPVLRLLGQAELSELLEWTGARTADAYWQLTIRADEYRKTFWQRLDEQCGGPVDVLLSPPYALPALRHGTAVHLLRAASHAFLANLTGCPAGVVPWGVVTAEDERAEQANPARTGWDLGCHFARENAKGSTGLPLSVEVMTRPGRDDIALAVMAELEQAVSTN